MRLITPTRGARHAPASRAETHFFACWYPGMKYAALPARLGFTLANRIVMGSMHTGLEDAREQARGLLRSVPAARVCWVSGGTPNCAAQASPSRKLSSPRGAAASTGDRRRTPGGRRICMQILHTGRYAYHPSVAPSAARPINRFRPRQLSSDGCATRSPIS